MGLSIPEVAGRARQSLDPAASALVARMSGAPDPARVGLIDALVHALKAAGVWAKLDLLYLMAAHDAQAARLNWVGAANDLAAVNAPGFTVDRGYAGDGATSYLDTGWTASGSARFLTDSASLGCWINAGTDTGSDFAVAMGARDASNGAFVGPRGSGNAIRGRVNQASSAASSGTVATRMRLAPEVSTAIVTSAGGSERRNADWAEARTSYDVGPGVRSEGDIAALLGFFRARMGPARGFRLRDPFDFSGDGEALGVGDGEASVFALRKTYGDVTRRITRPVSGSVRVFLDGVETSAFSVSGGVVTLDAAPDVGVAVTASFLFDVPVRFAEDRLSVSGATFLAGAAASVPLVEIRE